MKSNIKECDLFVIGAGSGGVRAARLAAQSGADVVIAEKYRIGGTCVIRGCIPKKLLSYSSKFSKHNIIAQSYGWSFDEPRFSWKRLIENKNKEIQRLSNIYKTNLEKSGANVIESEAKIIDRDTVELSNGDQFKCKKILIATGAKPNFPNITGIEYGISSDDFFELDKLPENVVIIGGGYIALEFASIISGLGTMCELIYRGDKLLKNFDVDISNNIYEQIQSDKCKVRLNTDITKLDLHNGKYIATLNDGATISTDLVLFATGRISDLSFIGDKIVIETDASGRVIVDSQFQTSIPNIYAIGDVANNYHLTPLAIREAMIFAREQFEKDKDNYIIENIPTAVFSNPEIGTIGLSEQDALQKYKKIDIYTSSFRPLYYTLSDVNKRTFIKLIIDHKTQVLIGFHMMGDDSAELTQIMSTLINKKASKTDLDNTIPLHPSTSEEIMTMRNKVTKEL